MRLVSMTIENFRSIKKARKISIGKFTTLLGPNNEGKSNILRALYIGMSALRHWEVYSARSLLRNRPRSVSSRRAGSVGEYNWETDFPVGLQTKEPNGVSSFTLEFLLTAPEVGEFVKTIGSNLNGTLPIQIDFGTSGIVASIAKQGRGNKSLNSKKGRILEFVSRRLDVQYIPAVRTATNVEEIVERLVARELRPVEDTEEYQNALTKLRALQQPILDNLGLSITETIGRFIPSLNYAKISSTTEGSISALRSSIDIIIDDGVPTPLRFKGDGIQSLVALGMMRHSSMVSSDTTFETIIALEEPESHLHPSAIHQLKQVLNSLADNNQIVITTHNPVFVNRGEIASNVIVNKNRAYPAKNIKEIRDVLGVEVADNLTGAEVVLIVEGTEDELALRGVLKSISPILNHAIESGRLGFDPMGGAGNLTYKVGLHRSHICKVHVFLDHDEAGKKAFARCEKDQTLSIAEVNFARACGLAESEFEDLIDPAITGEILLADRIDIKKTRKNKGKWSDRLESACELAGKPLSPTDLAKYKMLIAESVSKSGISAISPINRGPIENLAESLEGLLGNGSW